MPDTELLEFKVSNINAKHTWFRLSKRRAQLLLGYLIFLTFLGFLALCLILIKEISPFSGLSVFSLSTVSAIATSLLGSSIYYSRKLYKACINQDMLTPQDENDSIRQLGVTSYYLSRPLYAVCLSLIASIAIRSGTEFISSNGVINEKYTYLIMLVSFFVGYSSSDFIDDLENKGRSIVNGVVKNEKK